MITECTRGCAKILVGHCQVKLLQLLLTHIHSLLPRQIFYPPPLKSGISFGIPLLQTSNSRTLQQTDYLAFPQLHTVEVILAPTDCKVTINAGHLRCDCKHLRNDLTLIGRTINAEFYNNFGFSKNGNLNF